MGNGTSIRVWEDAWLPWEGAHLVPSPLPYSNLDLRVNEPLDDEMNALPNSIGMWML